MRAWLLHIGEELPVDGAQRKFRYGYLAHALAERGHQVLRWAPTFRHQGKSHRFTSDRRVEIRKNYAIQFVHSPGYRRNVGVERLRTYRVLGRRFRRLAESETPPDVVVAAIPSLEWAEAATDFGQRHRVPVVIDVRDLWPDVFLNALPKAARGVGRLFLGRYGRAARRACAQATALTAVSPSYLEWALTKAGRPRRPNDQVLPLGFESEHLASQEVQKHLAAFRGHTFNPAVPICVFAGSFERSYDLETVIEAARELQGDDRTPVQFVFCGDGSKLAALKRRAAGIRRVHFTGWIDGPMLQAILSVASIGLCAYADDALQSVPNKPFEYMANRLAVVSSLSGDLAEMLNRHRCGFTFRTGDSRSLAKCLRDLLGDSDLLSSLRDNAFRAWSANYRSSVIYDRFVTHLTSLARTTARAA